MKKTVSVGTNVSEERVANALVVVRDITGQMDVCREYRAEGLDVMVESVMRDVVLAWSAARGEVDRVLSVVFGPSQLRLYSIYSQAAGGRQDIPLLALDDLTESPLVRLDDGTYRVLEDNIDQTPPIALLFIGLVDRLVRRASSETPFSVPELYIIQQILRGPFFPHQTSCYFTFEYGDDLRNDNNLLDLFQDRLANTPDALVIPFLRAVLFLDAEDKVVPGSLFNGGSIDWVENVLVHRGFLVNDPTLAFVRELLELFPFDDTELFLDLNSVATFSAPQIQLYLDGGLVPAVEQWDFIFSEPQGVGDRLCESIGILLARCVVDDGDEAAELLPCSDEAFFDILLRYFRALNEGNLLNSIASILVDFHCNEGDETRERYLSTVINFDAGMDPVLLVLSGVLSHVPEGVNRDELREFCGYCKVLFTPEDAAGNYWDTVDADTLFFDQLPPAVEDPFRAQVVAAKTRV